MSSVYLLDLKGKMNQAIQEELNLDKELVLQKNLSNPIDIVIDFSSPSGFTKGLNLALELNKPFLSGTTALSKEHEKHLHEASSSIAVLHSSNFSLGISLIKHFLHSIHSYADNFYIDLFESHHRSKKDAPSGTTYDFIKLFENKNLSSKKIAMRQKNDLHVHAERTPYFSCQHSIKLSNELEQISITHTSNSRKVYAQGALQAAKWLLDQQPGLYNSENIFKSLLSHTALAAKAKCE